MRSMKEQYGPKKGESVFYASRNKGIIKGVEKNMGKNKQVGGIINPIQPMYNPTASDMQRQQGMMDSQQMQRPLPQGTPNMAEGGKLKEPPAGNVGLKKLPTEVRNKMGFKNRGGLINNGSKDYRKSGMFYGK